MNSTENIECDPTGNTPSRSEEKLENDIGKIEMAGIKRLKINTKYHKDHADELKRKRRDAFLKLQEEKRARYKELNGLIFTRKCPSCNLNLYYSNKRNLIVALQNNHVCKFCSFNVCHATPPHNKGKYVRTEKERRKMARNYALKRNFGLTQEDYDLLFKSQMGQCKICGVPQSQLSKPLYVDHCHKTKRIRGLLCRDCNAGLGLFKDNPNILKVATEYLGHFGAHLEIRV